MANVIHKATLAYFASVNTPDYSDPPWQHNPDMSAVAGVPRIYWKAPAIWTLGAGPVQMIQAERDAVDAALLAAAQAQAKLDAKALVDLMDDAGVVLARNANRIAFAAIVETRGKVNELIGEVNTQHAAGIVTLPSRTWGQVKGATKSQIDAETDPD